MVAFHAEIPGFEGGFIGVDVFFVLSGWLITRQLVAPIEGGGQRSLLTFWAGRVRRLVPAMAVMIVVVFGLSLVMLSPLEWHLIAARGAAAALYISNLLFARSAGNYFSGTLQSSPYLHTWSLGVEEQFYLFWPLIFAVTGRFARRDRTVARRAALGAVALIGIGSFLVCIVLTDRSPYWAFYGLPSRAWEFAAGGLAVILWPSALALGSRLWRLAPIIGVALVLACTFTYDNSTAFPGWHALIPVVGTLLIIVGGQATGAAGGPVEHAFVWSPSRRLGRLSYSWYLWHWPFIVLAVEWSFTNNTWIRSAAALAALPVAALSLRFVERPVRSSATLVRSRAKTFAFGAIVTLLVLGCAAGVELASKLWLEKEPIATYAAQRDSFSHTGCTAEASPKGIPYCVGGDVDSDRTVMLIGDSHALQWMAAVSKAGEDAGVRIVLRQAGNCSAVPPVAGRGPSGTTAADCLAFQRQTTDLIAEIAPQAVVLSDATTSRKLLFDDDPDQWARAFTAQADRLEDQGVAVGLIRDNPISHDPLNCLARLGRGTSDCTPSRQAAMRELDRYRPAERRALQRPDGTIPEMDLADQICGPDVCPIEQGDTWVFAASNHLTRDYTLSQVDQVKALLDSVLAERNPS